MSDIVQKLWGFCHTLRHDGIDYGDYIEQITFLLFLKMADELTKPPHNRKPIVPPSLGWASLMKLNGDELDVHYPMAKNIGYVMLPNSCRLRAVAARGLVGDVRTPRVMPDSVPGPHTKGETTCHRIAGVF